jgi:glycosyltransferase involved in cell wall biosynthesis
MVKKNNISGLIITRNQEETIKKSVESLQDQDEALDEIIIFNDKSNDSTTSILQNIASKDKRISLMMPSHRVGPSGALNAGINACKSEFLIISGGDDYSLPFRSQVQKTILSHHQNINLLYNRAYINGESVLFHPIERDLLEEQTQVSEGLFTKLFWNLNFLCSPASAVRINKNNRLQFNEYLIQLQDFYMNLKQASKNQVLWDPTLVSNYTKSDRSLSGSVSNIDSKSYRRFVNEISFVYKQSLKSIRPKTIFKLFSHYLPQQSLTTEIPLTQLKDYILAFLYLSHDNFVVNNLGRQQLMELASQRLFEKRTFKLFSWSKHDIFQEVFDTTMM